MSTVEEDYSKLVGASGYAMALRAAELLCPTPHDRELLFASLCNAYWRGKSDALDQARTLVRRAIERTTQ